MIRQVVRAVVVSAMLVACIVLAVAPAGACSCAPLAADRILAEADLAFVGRVVDEDVRSSDGRTVQTFAVERVAKGDIGPTFRLVADIGPTMVSGCAVLFPRDERVGVTVYRSVNGAYSASLCSHIGVNRLLDLSEGGRPPSAAGTASVPAVPAETVLGLPPLIAAVGFACVVAAAVALPVVVGRRRRSADGSTTPDR